MHKELKDSLNYIFEKEKLHESQKPITFKRNQHKSNKWIPTVASLSFIAIAFMLFLPYLTDTTGINQGSNKPDTQLEKTEIFNYKGAYIGDNGSVGRILSYSMDGQSFNGFQIYSSNEPFGVRAFMGKRIDPSTDYSLIVTTASYLFTLIRNIDFVEFEYLDQVYSIRKSDLELAFDIEFYSFEDEASLQTLLSNLLSNDESFNIIQELVDEKTL